jgi:hypothetical protein
MVLECSAIAATRRPAARIPFRVILGFPCPLPLPYSKAWSEEADAQRGELERALAAVRRELTDSTAAAGAAAARAAAAHEQEVAALRSRLEQAQGEGASVGRAS